MTLSRITVKETQCVDFSVRTDTTLPAEKLATSRQLSGHTDFRISPCAGAERGEVLVFCHSLRLPLHRTVSQRRIWFPDCVLSTDIPKLANVVFAHVL
jgi:hypothetical protein